MPRIRTIKPVHWSDKRLALISLPAHLLWIGTWTFSDDEGVFEGDANFIKSQVFPRRTDVTIGQIDEWIKELVGQKFIIPFTFEMELYFITRTFKTHQKIDKPYPSKVPIELINSTLKNIPELIVTRSENVSRTVVDRSAQVEESNSTGIVEERESRNSRKKNGNEFLIWDIEKYLQDHQKDWEAVCMAHLTCTQEKLKEILQKYHLHCQRKEEYPKNPLPLIAGFKMWILNEKNFTNGTDKSKPGQSNGKLGTSEGRTAAARRF